MSIQIVIPALANCGANTLPLFNFRALVSDRGKSCQSLAVRCQTCFESNRMNKTDRRRPLEFSSLDEVVNDINALLENGYESVGKWDLAQCCGHLNEWMRFPMDGYPKPNLVVGLILGFVKMMRGKSMLAGILQKKTFPEGGPTMPDTVFNAGSRDDGQVVSEFAGTIDRLKNYQGKIQPSPLFGEMDRDTMIKLQLVHCAHHLSFLLPRNAVG